MIAEAETIHRWPARAMTGDYLRAGAGLAVTLPPLFYVEWTASVVIVLGGLSALFAWLGLRTATRHRARVRLSGGAVARDGKVIPWGTVRAVRLRRFGARRKGTGYMEMIVTGAGTRIKVDSEISGFLQIARAVFRAALQNGAAMDSRTAANFETLGILPR